MVCGLSCVKVMKELAPLEKRGGPLDKLEERKVLFQTLLQSTHEDGIQGDVESNDDGLDDLDDLSFITALVQSGDAGNSRSDEPQSLKDGDKSCFGYLISYKTVIFAWISMVLAIMAGSGIGPMFKYMYEHNIPPRLAASWRCQCMSLILLPIAMIESKYDNSVEWFANKSDLQYKIYIHVLIAGLAWAVNLVAWISGLEFTTTVHASLFASLHPLVLVVYIRVIGEYITYFEWTGIFVALLGVIIAASQGLLKFASSFSSSEDPVKNELLGDVLCIIASLSEALVIINRRAIKKYVPLFQYTFATTLIVAICSSIASFLFDGTSDIGTDDIEVFCLRDNCIFGWMSSKWIVPILLFGFIVGVICVAGFNYAVMYISPLVFSSILLVDPAITGMISWSAGLEDIPSLQTWVGGLTVVTGVLLIIVGENSREKHNDSVKNGNNNNNNNKTSTNNDKEYKDAVELVGKKKKDNNLYSILPSIADDVEDEIVL